MEAAPRLNVKKQTLDDAYAAPGNVLEIDIINPITHGIDFGSTNSLESSSNSLSAPFKHALSSKTQDRVIRLDPLVYRKQRERNISLRSNLSEKLMKPAVLTGIRKMDKLSENISNHQILVQDVLFQSRIVTSNLEQLQKQLDKFGTENYLKEIKTGSSIADRNLVEIDIPSTNGNMSTFLPL
ncbi:unnamed protein product [Allacma fusca]|uniref:Uncharacterized protein n=1 Tax=Allacma fusca TaxID=39272 RepID=A0A8J2KK23_9HEXA|nr:unnamed protein product [Allacma fusca]